MSLTSIVCKTFEGFIRDALSKHIKTNGLLSNHQHGFTTGRSCITQLLTTLNDWFSRIDNGNHVDVIYLDLQKAFDKIPHRRLLTKLEGYGVHGQILCWIEDFLSNRTQYVSVGDEHSDDAPVTNGVPQSSILGSTLFVYFINDMPDIINYLIKVVADDTKVYTDALSSEQRTLLQSINY